MSINRILFTVLCAWSFVISPSMGQSYEDLSEEARKIVPQDDLVRLHLDNGSVQEGMIVREDAKEIVLKQKKGSIAFEFTYPVDRVERREQKDICDVFARVLLERPFQPDEELSVIYIQSMADIHDEFLAFCPDHSQVEKIRAQGAVYRNADTQKDRGQVQIDGEWMNPVEAALYQIERNTSRLEFLLEKYSGVDRPGYRGDPRIPRAFEHLKTQRMELVQQLPDYLQGRLPELLRDRRYEDAFGELDALHGFYLDRLAADRLKKRSGGRLKDPDFDAEINGMDYRRIPEFINQSLTAYQFARGETGPEPLPGHESMLRIPGGFFLMGDPLADPAREDNPGRLAYVKDFAIDAYEVTNAEYREFVDHVKLTGDTSMEHPNAPPLKDHTPAGWTFPKLAEDALPVIGVDWYDAYAYAKWKGKRLPTETEWEYLATGMGQGAVNPVVDSGNRFINAPQSMTYLHTQLVAAHRAKYPPPPPEDPRLKKLKRSKEPSASVPPVKTLKRQTWAVNAELPPEGLEEIQNKVVSRVQFPSGIYHIVGNAPEWMQDAYDPVYPLYRDMKNPAAATNGTDYVFRGGGFDIEQVPAYASFFRGAESKLSKTLKRKEPLLIGFRCALDVEGK